MFEAAARELNFTHAADVLSVTQGAVSRQIKLLEEELGEALFDRHGPRLTLTPAGQEYRLVVEDALRIIRQGVALGRDLLVADDLRVGRLVRPYPRGIRSIYNYYFVCSLERVDVPEIQTFLIWLRGEMQETIRQVWATQT
jgi:DNA-binding transcriptional LysR family regulator